MSNYYNRQWRLPNEENKSKVSNYSMEFNGSSQYIDIDSSSFGSDSFSISLWFKQDTGTGFQGLFAGSGYDGGTGLIIYTYLNTVKIYTAVSGSTTNILTSTTFSFDTWYHVILKREYNVGWSLYIDGTEVNTYSSLTTTDLTSANTRIGKHYTSGLYFNGQIDGVAIFDYALSSSQVTTLYGSSSTGIGNPMSLSPAPVAYYPLGDQDAFNGADYLVPNSSLKDYVFDFDGSSSEIDLGTSVILNSSSAFSFSSWVNLENYTNYAYPYIVKLKTSATNGWRIMLSQSSGYEGITIGNNGTFAQVRTSGNISQDFLNSWNHIAVTYNGSGSNTISNWKIYVNGSSVSLITSGVIGSDANTSFIGSGDGQRFFIGKISNVSIFSNELTSPQVATIYNNGAPSDISSLSPTAWYKLNASDTYDSSTGNWTIEDHAGSNDGTSSGMTQANLVQSDLSFTSGYSPYALSFDGTNDYIDTPQINLGSTNSISFWINRTLTAEGTLFGDPNGTTNYALYIYGGKIYFRLGNGDGGYWENTPLLSGVLSDGNWHHHCLSRDAGTINYYIDAVLQTNVSTNTLNTSAGTNTTIENIFAKSNGTSPISGNLSNISIWNTNLSASQVREIYSEGVPQNLNNHSAYSNLVSWWQLGSNTSWVDPYWIALDEKGTNNGESQNVAAPNNMGENAIVDGVGSYANGLSNGMGGDEVIGDAPYSTANALSVNMDVEDRVTGISNATITTGGTGYTTGTNISTTGGTGSGCTVDITASGAITAVTINNSGLGYSVGEVLTVVQSGGLSGTITVTSLNTPS